MITNSVVIQDRVQDRAKRAEEARAAAFAVMADDPRARRLWLWIRDVVLAADRRDGRWGTTDMMDQALEAVAPEVAARVAKDRLAIELDDIAHRADLAALSRKEMTR